MSKTTFTVGEDKRTLTAERTFAAPQTKLWQAFADPAKLARWWGPRGWETEIKHMDFQKGGYWHYGMKCVDPAQGDWFGKVSWGKGTFGTVHPQDLFEYVDAFCDEHGVVTPGMPVATTTMRFAEKAGATKVTSTTVYPTAEALSQVLNMGMEQGFSETWDRLDEFVTK